MIEIGPADAATDWAEILDLLHRAFAVMEGRIDPPSSLHDMDEMTLAAKAASGACLLAVNEDEGEAVIGCVFLQDHEDGLYVSKLAVDPDRQGEGIGRALMTMSEDIARAQERDVLILETRIELDENHLTFARLGFEQTGQTAHPGFDRPTSITMRKALT